MYTKILVGYDGSEAGKKAFETALQLAATHGAQLYVLTVCRPPEIGDDVETEAVIENSRRHHRGLLAELKPAVAAKGVNAHFESQSDIPRSRSSMTPTGTGWISSSSAIAAARRSPDCCSAQSRSRSVNTPTDRSWSCAEPPHCDLSRDRQAAGSPGSGDRPARA